MFLGLRARHLRRPLRRHSRSEAGATRRAAGGTILDQRPADPAAGRAGAPADRLGGSLGLIALLTGTGMVAQWRRSRSTGTAVRHRSATRRRRPAPSIRSSAGRCVLSLHAAGLAARRRLADDARPSSSSLRRLRSSWCPAARACSRRDAGRRRRTACCAACPSVRRSCCWCSRPATYLGRFEQLVYTDHTIFSGVAYTDAHVTLTGMLVVAVALGARRGHRAGQRRRARRRSRWLVAAVVPAARRATRSSASPAGTSTSFIVKPNELVRETPYIAHNIEMTRQAYALDRIEQQAVPRRDAASRRSTPPNNQETLENIRLWDWRALQDTLRQIQEIRTYYDFPDIDIDRYEIDGAVRQMMLAVARAERRAAAREQPQLDQREADLHARLRRDDEPGQRLHAGRAARRSS